VAFRVHATFKKEVVTSRHAVAVCTNATELGLQIATEE
jgi:hypothetical protein